MFELHPQLNADCIVLGRFRLSLLLMHSDGNYPWFILVPCREDMREIYQLENGDQHQLLEESSRLSQVLMDVFSGDKLNVAALGNMVPQLHIHHIVRYRNDPAWPGPVWGVAPKKEFTAQTMTDRINDVLSMLVAEDFESLYQGA